MIMWCTPVMAEGESNMSLCLKVKRVESDGRQSQRCICGPRFEWIEIFEVNKKKRRFQVEGTVCMRTQDLRRK